MALAGATTPMVSAAAQAGGRFFGFQVLPRRPKGVLVAITDARLKPCPDRTLPRRLKAQVFGFIAGLKPCAQKAELQVNSQTQGGFPVCRDDEVYFGMGVAFLRQTSIHVDTGAHSLLHPKAGPSTRHLLRLAKQIFRSG